MPWGTPHTFDKDGKLELTPAAKGWLDEAIKQRGSLVEEAQAEAGDSKFKIEDSLRKRLVEAQVEAFKMQPDAEKQLKGR